MSDSNVKSSRFVSLSKLARFQKTKTRLDGRSVTRILSTRRATSSRRRQSSQCLGDAQLSRAQFTLLTCKALNSTCKSWKTAGALKLKPSSVRTRKGA